MCIYIDRQADKEYCSAIKNNKIIPYLELGLGHGWMEVCIWRDTENHPEKRTMKAWRQGLGLSRNNAVPQGLKSFHGPGTLCLLIPIGSFQTVGLLFTIHMVLQARATGSPCPPCWYVPIPLILPRGLSP